MESRKKVNPYIFRAYDIRGLTGVDLTPETARLIGLGFGSFVREHGGASVAVGQGNRVT